MSSLKFKTLNQCNEQNTSHVSDQEQEVYLCASCQKVFQSAQEYQIHVKVHSEEYLNSYDTTNSADPLELVDMKQEYCFIEGKNQFIKIESLSENGNISNNTDENMSIIIEQPVLHSGILGKAYYGTPCGTVYGDSRYLVSHNRIRSAEIPFMCNICSRPFMGKARLQAHMLKHEGLERFKCKDCPAEFWRDADLVRHVRRLHVVSNAEGRTIKCRQCNCVFNSIQTLRSHTTRQHSDSAFEESEQDDQIDTPQHVDTLNIIESDCRVPFKNVEWATSETSGSDMEKLHLNHELAVIGEIQVEHNHASVIVSGSCSKVQDEIVQRKRVHIATSRLDRPKKIYLKKYFGNRAKNFSKRPYQCRECLKGFSSSSAIIGHLKSHKKLKNILWNICHNPNLSEENKLLLLKETIAIHDEDVGSSKLTKPDKTAPLSVKS